MFEENKQKKPPKKPRTKQVFSVFDKIIAVLFYLFIKRTHQCSIYIYI